MREAFDADRIIYEEEIATLRKTIDGLCMVLWWWCVCAAYLKRCRGRQG